MPAPATTIFLARCGWRTKGREGKPANRSTPVILSASRRGMRLAITGGFFACSADSNGMNTYLGDELYQAAPFHETPKGSDPAEHAWCTEIRKPKRSRTRLLPCR